MLFFFTERKFAGQGDPDVLGLDPVINSRLFELNYCAAVAKAWAIAKGFSKT
ncbi:MAG: hypothetical protein QNK92_08900 [Amylibacter sp.]